MFFLAAILTEIEENVTWVSSSHFQNMAEEEVMCWSVGEDPCGHDSQCGSECLCNAGS